MASSKNNSGLKILWIPGRKKHDKKGVYSSTNKEVNKNYLPQKKNQVWALGGNEQRKLININHEDDLGSSSAASAISAASQATHIVNPVCLAAVGTGAVKGTNDSDDKLNLDECCDGQEKIVDKEILRNGEAGSCNTDNIDVDMDDQAYHNAGTIRYRKKNGSNNTDLDSIEHLDFDDDEKHDMLEDDIDSVSMQRMRTANVSSRRRRHTKKKFDKLENEKEKDKKVVDCLYFGLICCDIPCTIL